MKRIGNCLLAGALTCGLAGVAFAGHGHGKGKKRHAERLMEHDADKDGALSAAELQNGLKAMAETRHKKMDHDGDGFVTKEERESFKKAHMEEMAKKHPEKSERKRARHDGHGEKMQKRMKRADADADGKLSLSEVVTMAEKRAAKMLERKDANKNGKLEKSELLARRGKGKKRHR